MLTERKEAWSPRCPRFSLRAGEGEEVGGVKAGAGFPPEAPRPLEALLLACRTTPTDGWRGGHAEVKGHVRKTDMAKG